MIPVNIVLRFGVSAGPDDPATEYMAVGHWLLPGIPRKGEEIVALDHRILVDKVQWAEGQVAVYLEQFRANVSLLDRLEQEGWEIGPWEDEPPGEWFGEQ